MFVIILKEASLHLHKYLTVSNRNIIAKENSENYVKEFSSSDQILATKCTWMRMYFYLLVRQKLAVCCRHYPGSLHLPPPPRQVVPEWAGIHSHMRNWDPPENRTKQNIWNLKIQFIFIWITFFARPGWTCVSMSSVYINKHIYYPIP